MRHLRVALAASASLAVLTVVRTSDAGAWANPTAYCAKAPDFSGWCNGTINAFRNSSDANANASFFNEGSTYGSFSAELNGSWYGCTTTSVPPQWIAFSSPDTWFQITWNSAGTCNLLQVNLTSYYQ
jgi:hypothetical protein